MAIPVEKLGTSYPPATTVIDPDRAKAHAAATNDPNPAYTSGKYAPPVFGVVPTWNQMLDESATPVLTQYVTIFVRGMADGESDGPARPAHDFPDDARAKQLGTCTIHVDDDQTFRYRDASGDEMPIHLDDAVAKSVGLPGIIAQGLCTMAMCSQAVIALAADGDPARLKRRAVRFASNVFPGNDVDVAVFDAGTTDSGLGAYAFEATSAGAVVVKNGWAEVEA